MKLLRHGSAGEEKPEALDKDGSIRDVSRSVKDLDGHTFSPASLATLADLDLQILPPVTVNPRLGVPVTGVSKFIAIGLNYLDHAKESNMPIPSDPIVFMKATSCHRYASWCRDEIEAAAFPKAG